MGQLGKLLKSGIAVAIVASFIASPIAALKPVMASDVTNTSSVVVSEVAQPETKPDEVVPEDSNDTTQSDTSTKADSETSNQDSERATTEVSEVEANQDGDVTITVSDPEVVDTDSVLEPQSEASENKAEATTTDTVATSEIDKTVSEDKSSDKLSLEEKEKRFREKLTAQGEAEENDFIIRVADGMITGYRGATIANLVIPATVSGTPVKGIENKVFQKKGVETLVLPEGIEIIKEESFAQNALKEITIPDSLLEIGVRAFAYNKDLKKVLFGQNPKLREIKKMAFRNNAIETFAAPSSLEKIGDHAFLLNSLNTLTLGSVQEIGDYAFSSNKLSEVVLPDTLVDGKYGAHIFDKNGRYVYTTGSAVGRTDVTKDSFGSIHNPVSIRVKGIDKDTRKEIQPLTVIENDPFKDVNKSELLFEGATLRRPAPKVPGYSSDAISLELTKANIEANETSPYIIEYFDEKYKPTFAGLEPLEVAVDEVADLRAGVTATSGSGDDLTADIVITPEPLNTSESGVFSVVYSITDSLGNTVTESRDVLVGIDPLKVEVGGGWLMEDFTFSGERLMGLSALGTAKLENNKDLFLPSYNPLTKEKMKEVVSDAFGRKGLYTVSIPDNYEKIGARAFQYNSLLDITLPSQLKTLEREAFRDNQISGTVAIPKGVEMLGWAAFFNNHITDVTLEEGLKTIDEYVFGQNEILEVTFPNSLETIGYRAFYQNKINNIEWGTGVNSIGNESFYNNNLPQLLIPSSLKTIGHRAFAYNKLTSIEVPDTVDTIGIGVFQNNNLTEFFWPAEKLTEIPEDTFRENKIQTLPNLEGLTKIGKAVFYRNDFKSVKLPSTLKVLGRSSFNDNRNLEELELNEGLEEIGAYSFINCAIKKKVLQTPSSLLTIGSNAFSGTHNEFDKVILNEGLTTIGSESFQQCRIYDLVIPSTVAYLEPACFLGNRLSEVDIPEGVTRIGYRAFDYWNNDNAPAIRRVSLPSSLTTIDSYAFRNNKLIHVDLPENVTTIGGSAFENNALSGHLVIPEGVTSIGGEAFGNNAITEVTLPDTVETMGDGVFASNGIKVAKIPSGLHVIPSRLYARNGITDLVIPSHVTEIKSDAFTSNAISSLTFEPNSSLTTIEDGAFRSNSLREIVLPTSVQSIGSTSFSLNDGMDLKPNYLAIKILDDQGQPINPNNIENVFDEELNTGYIINPSYIVVKNQTASGKKVSVERYYFGSIGDSISITPQEGVAYKPLDPSERTFTITKDPHEETIIYVEKPDFDARAYHIEIKHTDIQDRNDNRPEGEKYFYPTQRMPFVVRASVSGDAAGLQHPSITIDFNKLVRGGFIEAMVYPDIKSMKRFFKSYTFKDGILDLVFREGREFGAPGSQVEIPLAIRFKRFDTPRDYVIDLNDQVSLYDNDTLVKTADNDVRFRARNAGYYYRKHAESNGYVWRHDFDEEGYAKQGTAKEAVFTYSIFSDNYNLNRYYDHIQIVDTLPIYTGKDASGVVRTDLRAQLVPDKSPGWTLGPDGTTAILDMDFAKAASGTQYVAGLSGRIPVPPLVLNFPGVKADFRAVNTQNYTLTPYNRSDKSVKTGMKPTDPDALQLEPLTKGDASTGIIFKNLDVPRPEGNYHARLYKFTADFYGDTSWGVPSVVGDPDSPRVNNGRIDYNYKNKKHTYWGDWTGSYSSTSAGKRISAFLDSDSERHQTFRWRVGVQTQGYKTLTDIVVKDYGLDERMHYTGIWLPDNVTAAILKVYDASDSLIDEHVIHPGTYNFPESIQRQIKSFTLDFQSMRIERQSAYEEGGRWFYVYARLNDPDSPAFTDDETNGNVWSFAPNLFYNKAQMTCNIIPNEETGEKEAFESREVSDPIKVLPYEASTKLVKEIISRPPDSDPEAPIEDLSYGINQEVRFALSTETNKPSDLSMKNFKFLDVLPEYLLPSDLVFTKEFLDKAVNPTFEFIENFEDTGRWGLVIKADEYNPGGKDYKTLKVKFAELIARTAANVENKVYTNVSYLTATGDPSWNRPSADKPAYKFFENDVNVIKGEDWYAVNTVKSLNAFKFVKNSRDLTYQPYETDIQSDEDFSYRLTVGNNLNDPAEKLLIYDVLPYHDDVRLVKNDSGVRVPRGTTLNKTGSEAMPKVVLSGPVQIPQEYSELYDVYYTTADTATLRDAEETAIITQTDLWSMNVADYSAVTGIMIKLKAGSVMPPNTTHNFFIPMRGPHNENFQYDGMYAVNSYAYRVGSDTAPLIEVNNVRTLQKSPRATLEVRKKSDWPTEKDYLPNAKFTLYRLAPEDAPAEEILTKGDYRVYKDPVFVPSTVGYVTLLKTNSQGIARFSELMTNTDYVLEELEAPQGYTIKDDQRYTLITGEQLKGTEESPLFYAKEIVNHKVYFPLIKRATASLDFYKYGINGKPLPYTVFEISLDYNHPDYANLTYGQGDLKEFEKFNFKPRRAVASTTGLVHFGDLPILGVKYPPYIIKEISPRGTLQPIEPFHYKPRMVAGVGEKKLYEAPMVNDKAQINLYKLGMLDLSFRNVPLNKLATYMGRRLPDVQIQLYDSEGDTLVAESKTDGRGLITFKDLKLEHDYYFVEPNAVDDYRPYTDAANNNRINFRVSVDGRIYINGELSKFRYMVMPNYPERDTNQLVIRKVDEQGMSLAGADFELYKLPADATEPVEGGAEGGEATETGTPEPGTAEPGTAEGTTQDAQLVAKGTTDAFGNIVFKDFGVGEDAGKFKVVEKKAPLGYMIKSEPFEFTTHSNTLFFKELEVPNVQLNLSIDKYYLDDNNLKRPLAGAKFALYEGEGAQGTPIEEAVSNNQGKVAFNFALWDVTKRYSFKEIEAPQDYVLDTTVVNIPLPEMINRTGFDGTMHYERLNEPIKHTGTVILTKIDERTNDALPNVTFTLTSEDGTVVQTGTTNEIGIARISDLPYGTYTITEAPIAGYLPMEAKTVTVSEEDALKSIIVKNTPDDYSLTLKKVNEIDQALQNVSFKLERRFTDTNWTDAITETTDAQGSLTFTGLHSDSLYRLSEVSVANATPGFDGDSYKLIDDYYYVNVDKKGEISVTYKGEPVATPLKLVNERTNKKPNISFSVQKVWVGGEQIRTADIQVQLYRHNHAGQKEAMGQPVELVDNQGVLSYTYTDLPAEELVQLPDRQFYQDYRYTVEEVNTPAGFTASSEEPSEANEHYLVINTYNIPTAEVQASKTWVGGPTEKPTTWFKLYRKIASDQNFVAVPGAEIKELASGVTSVSWTDIEQTDSAANNYIFQVKEVDAQGNDATPLNYTKSQSDENLLNVTNTYVSPKISVTGTKVWSHGSTLTKPDTWFKLYRKIASDENFAAVEGAEIKKLEDGTTRAVWTDVDETDSNGNAYTYKVEEVNEAGEDYTPVNWTKEQTDNLTITNTYQIPTTASARVTKTWVGGENVTKPSSIRIVLFRKVTVNGNEMTENVNTAAKALDKNTGFVVFDQLEATDIEGRPYKFYAVEAPIPTNWLYRVDETGLNIINTYESPKSDITATKVWVNGAETKPTTWFKLQRKTENDADYSDVPASNNPVKSLANGKTSVEWTNMPDNDTQGYPYTYRVLEVDAQGNDFTPTNYTKVESGLQVTNTYVSPKVSVTGTKAWTNGSTLTKPDTWFKLYRKTEAMEDFEAVPAAAVKKLEDGTTQVTWSDIDETDSHAKAYSFAVREVNASGDDFTPTNWSKAQTSDLKITNSYVIPTDATATATKTWVGGSAIDKPDTWFKLYRKTDAMEAVEAVPNAEVKKLVNGVVEATWTGLEKTDLQGRPYTFSVKETDAQGNSIAPRNWTKSGDDTLAITNTYVSPRMKLTAEKAWVDGESLTKPDIWFKLMRKTDAMTDYEAVPNAEVKKLSDGQTQIEWTAIEETDAEARPYDFVVKEVNEAGEEAVPTNWQGEQTTAFKITNSYVIPTNGEVQATKTWVGGEAISKPDVWFTLYRKTVNDTAFKVVPDAEIKKLENGTTEVSWTGLEETDLQGYPYSFAVKETDAEGNAYSPENWKQVEGENLAIVNEYVPPVAKVSAEKVWVNGESLTKPDTWFKLFRKVNPAEAEAETDAEASEAPEAGADAEANEAPEAGADAEASEAPEAGADAEVSEAPEAGADAEANEAPEAGADAEASEAPEAGADAEASEAPEAGADAEASEAPEAGADAEASEATDVDVNPDADLEVVPNAEVTLLSDGTTKVNWSNIDQTDKAGRPYSFYVREVDAEGNDYTPINWKKEQTEDLKITNSYVIPEDASATAEKVWVGGPEAKPSVWFKLYREAKHTAVEAVPNAVVKELSDGLTKVSWNNLERTNLQGEAYEFSVREVDENGMNFVPENYSKEEAGLTVTNTFVPSKDATATAEKIWVGGPSEHPTIWFTLYRKTEDMKDFEQVPEAMIKELSSGETKVVWTNLQKTDDHARTYSFIVRETDAEGNAFVPKQYKKEELGLKVKNTYIPKPAKVSKTGETLGSLSISVFLLALAALVTELRRRVLRKNA